MAKPIFTIGINLVSQEQYEDILRALEVKLTDYHVILYIHNLKETKIQVFYDKDILEKDIDEIKSWIKEQLNS